MNSTPSKTTSRPGGRSCTLLTAKRNGTKHAGIQNGIKFWIIGPHQSTADSDTRRIHDACLVIKALLGERACLFAGDASDANLEYIANNTKNYCNDILHASHHASIEGAHLEFVKKCNAKYTLISTAAGKYENVPHPTALRRYKENTAQDVRRTDVDGTWKWTF